jgi:hypothetical protein
MIKKKDLLDLIKSLDERMDYKLNFEGIVHQKVLLSEKKIEALEKYLGIEFSPESTEIIGASYNKKAKKK